MVDTLKLALTFGLLALATAAAAQVRPDQFPESTSLEGVCFYTQEGSAPRKICMQTLRGGLSPTVKALSYTPSAAGNPVADRNAFGTDPNGGVWFIDYTGKSLRLGSGGGYLEQLVPNHTGATVTLTAPVADASKVRVWRSGRELRQAFGDFTIAGNQLTFTLPCTGNHLIIQTPL